MKNFICLFLVVFSFLLFTSCHREQNEIEISRIVEIQEDAIDMLNEASVPGQSGETIINNCIQQLLSNPEVSSAYVQDYDQILIKYKSGITSVILLTDDAEDQEKGNLEPIKINNKGLNDKVLITNHKILIWDWYGNHIADDLQNIFNNCNDIDFNVVVKRYFECNLQSLYDLTQYGMVFINTHGGVYENSHGEKVCWLLTRQLVSPEEMANEDVTSERKILVTTARVTKEYINNQEVRKFTKDGHYWAVSNKFISKNISGTFSSPSVVFAAACHTFDNSSLRDAFINDKNASIYLGFTNSSKVAFSNKKVKEFAVNMLQRHLSAKDAYDAIDVKVDDEHLPQLLEWYFNAVFGDHTHYVPPRAMLMCSRKEDPTYFVSKGYVECPALNKRWTLDKSQYNSNMDSQYWAFSQLQMRGDSARVVFRLSKKANMTEGTYTPFLVNDIDAAIEWEDNCTTYPMRFVTGTYFYGCCSYIDILSEDDYYNVIDGQLIYQKQNNKNKYIFNFTDENGYSYHGEYTE